MLLADYLALKTTSSDTPPAAAGCWLAAGVTKNPKTTV